MSPIDTVFVVCFSIALALTRIECHLLRRDIHKVRTLALALSEAERSRWGAK